MKYDLIVKLIFLFSTGLFFSPVYGQKKIKVIKIIDTVVLKGVMVYEYNNYPMYLQEEPDKAEEFGSYKAFIKAYKKSKNKMLSSFTLGSKFIEDDFDLTIKIDSNKCLYFKEEPFNNNKVLYHDYVHEIYATETSGLFYRVLFLDKYLYTKKHKIKYHPYLISACHSYERKYQIGSKVHDL